MLIINITAPTPLDAAAAAAARALLSCCNHAEALDLPITPQVDPDSRVLLAHQGSDLVGVAQINFGPEAEACLCVSPAWRRRGIGRRLAAAVRTHVASRVAGEPIFVSDAAAESGQAFATALGAQIIYAEHRLSLDLAAVPPAPAHRPGLRIRLAGLADADELAAVLAAAFGDPLAMVQSFVTRRLAHPTNRFILGELDGRLAGSLRLIEDAGWIYITTFGVRPDLHGRGVGRYLLMHTVGVLIANRQCRIRIEVETTNASAQGLYESCGFRRDRTYTYLRMPG
ncbi:MAG: GNAT family N-acetyltransferase [Chloroflexales bacterium]